MKKWEATELLDLYLTPFILAAVTHGSYVLEDCLVRIKLSLASFIICYKCAQVSVFQNRGCWSLSIENRGQMIVLRGTVHPIPDFISWTAC